MKYVFRKKRYVILAGLLDAMGYVIVRIVRRRKPLLDRNFKNILIVRMDHLGDVLLATGVPKLLKENFPGVRVTFLTSSWAAPLLEGNPFIDEVLIFDAPWFRRKDAVKGALALSLPALIGTLKDKRFDLGLGLRGDLRENFILWLSGIRERIGYGITGGGFFMTKEVPYRERIHERDRAANLLRPLGVKADTLKSGLYLSAAETVAAGRVLEVAGLGKDSKLVGFQWGAGTISKDWPAERVRVFLERFGKKFPDLKVVLVGGTLAEHAGATSSLPNCVNLLGKTTLRELCALMSHFLFFIGPDSGPTHIASALGVPTLFLFSGTNRFEEWRPLAENASVIRHQVPCSPCGLKICNVPGHPCMAEILPEEVLRILEERFESSGRVS